MKLGLSPFLIIKDASSAIEFYHEAFGAKEKRRMEAFEKVMFAELEIESSSIMISDEFPEFGSQSPQTLGGSPVSLHLYVDDVDVIFERALSAGGVLKKPVEDQFFGDRQGQFEDPFGYTWTVATRIEDLSNELLQSRMDDFLKQG